MTVADIIGFIGYVPLLAGTYLLTTHYKRAAWSSRVVGDLILLAAGLVGGMWSIVVLCSSFAVIDAYGLRKSFKGASDPVSKRLYRSLGNGTFKYLGAVDAAGHPLPKLAPGSSWGPPPPETDVKPVRRKVPSCPEHGTDVMGCEDSCPYRWKNRKTTDWSKPPYTETRGIPPMSKDKPYIPCQHCKGIGCDEYGRSDHEPDCSYLRVRRYPPCPDCGCGLGVHYSTCLHRDS